MAKEPDNLVLALLREFRSEMGDFRKEVTAEIAELRQRMDRSDATMLKALRSFVGHRSMVERTVADYDGDLADLKRRVRRLEEAQG